MNAKTWNRRLGKIAVPDRFGSAHAAWMRRGLRLLNDEELDELEALRERVVAVTLDGLTDDEARRLRMLLATMGGEANPPSHVVVMASEQRP